MIHAELDLIDTIELFEERLNSSRNKQIIDRNAGITARECGLVLEYLYELRELRTKNEELKGKIELLCEGLGKSNE